MPLALVIHDLPAGSAAVKALFDAIYEIAPAHWPMSEGALLAATGVSAAYLRDHLLRALKEAGYGRAKVEGLPHCDWVLIDAGDVIVHLFRPEVRAFYNIEKIWSVEPPRRAVAN